MKITLNLDQLLAQGRITESEYHHLKSLAETETSNLGLNILIGFGVLATTLGALALFPSPLSALQLGFILAALGIYGILAKSKLLAMFSALSLSATIGAMTAYGFASYQEPSLTILLFTILGWGSYQLSRKIPIDYEDIAIVFARTCLFLVNFGFWVGSLWGDENISRLVFVIGWALALIIAAIWAIRQEKRWVVNTLTVFGAIHFYTQYFERLGANPTSLMVN